MIKESHSKPCDVYEHITLQGHDTGDAPRDLAQVYRVVATVAVECALNKPVGSRNLADDVQKLTSLVHEHEFIREVHLCSHESPRILLYTDEQVADLWRFCTSNASDNMRSVLGIDRTFNLSAFYAKLQCSKTVQ